MHEYMLPDDIRGKWIWLRNPGDVLEEYVFFRKDFTLFESPASAELWITAKTCFHVYVNGRHLGFGPPPCPTEGAYVVYIDIGFLAETGANTIAVLAHNTAVSRLGAKRQNGGIWAQLNIDERPMVWTDESWLCKRADCYRSNRPRASISSGFVEYVDFRQYPKHWQDADFTPVRWERPDILVPLSATEGRLKAVIGPEWTVEAEEARAVVCRGACSPSVAVSWVSFSEMAMERGAGVYIAEAYVYSEVSDDVLFEMIADDPYRLFVNGECVKEQGVPALPARADLELCRPVCFRQGEVASPEVEVPLREGWNRLVVAQHVEPASAGFTLLWPDTDAEALVCRRKPENDAPEGWFLMGKFRTPLSLVNGNMEFAGMPKVGYTPAPMAPVDMSAFYAGCVFTPDNDIALPPGETCRLKAGQYVIVDFGATQYGCPHLVIGGSVGDVLDVMCGEQFVQGQLLPLTEGKRNVDTLLLGSGNHDWIGCSPRGFRYLKVIVRKASAWVKLSHFAVKVRRCEFSNPGSFVCSDERLNTIWEVGKQTLQATMQVHFLDAPAKDHTQYISDAMIQSWAAYHLFGAFDLAAKSIEEFSHIQFETGEMSAICPSDMYVHMPDYALMWPVWLHRHFLYTGDKTLLESMLPHLERLLEYYHNLASVGQGVLADLHLRCGAYCFLDHGDIDREGMVTGLNALYCRALLSGAWLFSQLGDAGKAEECRRRASHVARVVRELAWDEERGLFADGWYEGDMSEFYSWQTNVLAIYGGVAMPAHYDGIFDKLFSAEEPYELFAPGDAHNPFFKYFVLEAAFALGRRDWAVHMMRWYWGSMVDSGAVTWWELFDPEGRADEVPTFSMCHGYGVSPNGYLCTEVAGIRPAAPGFTMVYFNPLVGVVDWVKAHIPTPYGHINVDWRLGDNGECDVSIEANYPLEVIPVLAPGISETATIHVSDEVSILAAAE